MIEAGSLAGMSGVDGSYAGRPHIAVRQGALSLVAHSPANQGGLIRPVSPIHGNGSSEMCCHNQGDLERATGGIGVNLKETKKRGFVPQVRIKAARSMHSVSVGNEYLRVVCERVQLQK